MGMMVKSPHELIQSGLKKSNRSTSRQIKNLAILTRSWAEVVCGYDKQDVAALIVAPKGYGKSYTALELCWGAACEVALRKGGHPLDYFPYDQEKNWLPNCATINTNDIIELLRQTKSHNVYLLDDIGVAWNARKFRDKANILMNDIFELIRIDNTIIVMTVMDQSFVDKVPRQIIPYFIEISRKYHHLGYNELKVFQQKKHYRTGDLTFPPPAFGNTRFSRHYARFPPQWIAEAYDHMRAIKTKEDRDSKIAEFQGNGEKPIGKREAKWQGPLPKYGDKILALHMDGQGPATIAKTVPLGIGTIRKVIAAMSEH